MNGVRTLAKLTWVELKLLVREPLTVLFAFALPVIVLFVLGGVFGNDVDTEFYRGIGAMDFYVPAYVGLVIASVALISIPVCLVFSLGDLSEEPNNHLVVARKPGTSSR